MKFKRTIKDISLEEIENFMADKANLVAIRPKVDFPDDVSRLNNEQLIELVRKLDKWGYEDSIDKGNMAPVFNRAIFMMRLLGLNETAGILDFVASYALLINKFNPLIEEIKFKERLSKKNKDIASGPKNKLHDEIVTIMKLTWQKHQFASKNRMINKIIDRFGEARISRPTLERWIKLHGLGPVKIIRPAPDFSLVIPS